jgi:hypothetical protein
MPNARARSHEAWASRRSRRPSTPDAPR